LGIARVLYKRIRLNKPPQLRIIGAGGEENEAGAGVLALAGEAEGARGWGLWAVGRNRSVRGVFSKFDGSAGPIGDDVAAAEVIRVIEAQYFRGQFTPILVVRLCEIDLSASHPVGAAETGLAVVLAGGSRQSSPTAAPSERDAG